MGISIVDSLQFDLYQRCSMKFRSGLCVDHTKLSHPYVYDFIYGFVHSSLFHMPLSAEAFDFFH